MAKILNGQTLADIPPSAESMGDQLGLDRRRLKTSLAFAGADRVSEADIAELHALLDPRIPAVTDAFYRHLQKFPDLTTFFTSEEQMKQLARTMRTYLVGLGLGMGSTSYAEERLQIGLAHERIGLGPTWFLGAHAMLSDLIMNSLGADCAGDTAKLSRVAATLGKVLFFDASLAIHAYHQSIVTDLEETIAKVERAEAEVRRLSRLDGLTGTLNRTAMMESIRAELERFRRYGHEFTVLFLDFDHFKSINDSYGHAFGDYVLVESVSRIRDEIRNVDVIGRYGGEELVVLLAECGKRQGLLTAERIRHTIAERPFRRAKHPTEVMVTVSIGLHTPSRRDTKAETVLRLADRAMYAAKAAGRNCVIPYTPKTNR